MPAPLAAAAISTGAGLAGQYLSNQSNEKQNSESQQFSKEMYYRQLEQNWNFWHTQNEYNHPSNQKARMEAAGLNPALMYGQSATGAAGNATPAKSPDVKPAQFNPNDYSQASGGIMTALNQIYDFEIKGAQADNLKADKTLKDNQAILAIANSTNVDADTKNKLIQLQFDQMYGSEYHRERNRSLKTGTDVKLQDYELNALKTGATLQESVQRILESNERIAKSEAERRAIKSKIANVDQDTELKRLSTALKKVGIDWHDPIYIRVAQMYTQGYNKTEFGREMTQGYNKVKNSGAAKKVGSWIDQLLNKTK